MKQRLTNAREVRPMGSATVWIMASFLGWLAPSQVRAESLYEKLIEEAPTIVDKLIKEGYKTVGVLQFGVKIGDKNSLWDTGPINMKMAKSLETALVVCNKRDRPLEVLWDAAREAQKRVKNPTLDTKSGIEAFFKHRYPIYSDRKETSLPEVFLTGRIGLSRDYRITTVDIYRFDGKTPVQLKPLHTFTLKTSPFLLADAGVGYSFSRQNPDRPADKSVLDSVPRPIPRDDIHGPNTNPDPPSKFPVRLQIFYGKEEIKLEKDQTFATGDSDRLQSESFKIPSPSEETEVSFKVRNETSQKIGVVLMVGGKSTLFEEEDWRKSRRWVLDRGVEYIFTGYSQEDKKGSKPFKVLNDSDSEALFKDKGSRVGQLHLYVFRPSNREAADKYYDNATTSGLPLEPGRGGPISQAQYRARMLSTRGPSRGGAIIPGSGRDPEVLKEDQLGPVVPTDVMVVTFWKRKGG
jgi:hypothetical protein